MASFDQYADVVPQSMPFGNRHKRERVGNAQTTVDASIIDVPLTPAQLREKARLDMGFSDYKAERRPSNRVGGFGNRVAVNITADWADLATAMQGLPANEALRNVPVAAFPTDDGSLVSITTISKHVVRNLWRRGVAAKVRSIPTGESRKNKSGDNVPVYRDDAFDIEPYDAKLVLQRRAAKQEAGKLNASWAYHACTADTFGIEQA